MTCLTNGEALTVLSCFSLLIGCSSRFLYALEQIQGFSVCFRVKNPLNSPRITFNFQNKLYFQSEQQCRQHALYSHKACYNKSIRIPVRMAQII